MCGHHDQAGNGFTFFGASRGAIETDRFQCRRSERRPDMCLAMSVTKCFAQKHGIAFMRLDAEGERAFRRQYLRRGLEHRREIVEIHKNVGSKHEMIDSADPCLGLKEGQSLVLYHAVVESFRAR